MLALGCKQLIALLHLYWWPVFTDQSWLIALQELQIPSHYSVFFAENWASPSPAPPPSPHYQGQGWQAMVTKLWFDFPLSDWVLLFLSGKSTHFEEVFPLLILLLSISLLGVKTIGQPPKVRYLSVYSVSLVAYKWRVSTMRITLMSLGSNNICKKKRLNGLIWLMIYDIEKLCVFIFLKFT